MSRLSVLMRGDVKEPRSVLMALVSFTAEESSKSSLDEEETGWTSLSQPNEESATINHSHNHGHRPDRSCLLTASILEVKSIQR